MFTFSVFLMWLLIILIIYVKKERHQGLPIKIQGFQHFLMQLAHIRIGAAKVTFSIAGLAASRVGAEAMRWRSSL